LDNREKLDAMIAEACEFAGVSLVESDMFRAGKRRTLRLYIDKPEGVTIDDCSKVSRHLSDALDQDPEVVEGAYTLEVSSPGLDRPLKSVADLLRNKGRVLRVTRSTGKPLTGTLLEADENNLTLALKGNAGNVVVPRSEVLVAKVDVQI
jgi:ribosome maturation factor RimP